MDLISPGASGLPDALNQVAFADAALADEDEILASSDEVASGERFDLDAADGGIEVPIELGQRFEVAEVSGFIVMMRLGTAYRRRNTNT